MTCRTIRGADGQPIGFACSRGQKRESVCSVCQRRTAFLYACDWKLRGRLAGTTCSRLLCHGCAKEVGPEKHLCPAHARKWTEHPKHPDNVARARRAEVWMWLAFWARKELEAGLYARPRIISDEEERMLEAASERFHEKAAEVAGAPIADEQWKRAIDRFDTDHERPD